MSAGPAVVALVLALIGVVLEALLAGGDVARQLRELRKPQLSPPIGVWIAIGFFYYLTCFAVLYTLIAAKAFPTERTLAIVGVVAVMLMNAVWNLFFFRRRDLRTAKRLTILYAFCVLMLAIALFGVSRTAGWLFVPYAVYLTYGTWWTLATVELNTLKQ